MNTPNPQPNPQPADGPAPVPANVWARVAAFADGELPGEDCCALLEQALDHPDRARQVRYQQQLRELLAGCMDCEHTMRCPDELRSRLRAMADGRALADAPGGSDAAPAMPAAPVVAGVAATPGNGVTQRTGVLATIGRWAPLAAAAALFIAAAGLYLDANRTAVNGENAPAPTLIADQRVRAMETRHVRCASGVITTHGRQDFPPAGDTAALPDAINSELGARPLVAFDLTPVGFAYEQAGRCAASGGHAVHLVYHSTDARAGHRAISLWLQPAGDALADLPVNTPALVADDRQPHPLVVWRTDTLEHYLIGDSLADVRAAYTALTGQPLTDAPSAMHAGRFARS